MNTKPPARTRPIEEDDEELFEHLPFYEGATFGETPSRLDRNPPKPSRDRK